MTITRVGLVLLVLAIVATSTFSTPLDAGMPGSSGGEGGLSDAMNKSCINGNVGDCIDEDEEMMMDSEITRRTLAAQKRYISYDAMKKNSIPCSKRGNSYYHCTGHQKANPYSRSCTQISRCPRNTR
ncbi:hypothetical protein M9H77_21864 [Catharanthus roseus]|uniref:Uncharacterized protein n=1 Tax=Catharanthus roseus TaxID=4058 RepID=A0ACC0APJ7_CATRO|nr:hypothetical protein M9H77_21864 [Catharanthus roseus]